MEIIDVNVLHEEIEEIRSHLDSGKYDGKTLIWFGYTTQLNAIQYALMQNGKHLDLAIDNSKNKWWRDPFGILKCYPPDVLYQHKDDGVVFIATKHKRAMTNQVKSYGYSDEQIVYLRSPDELKAGWKQLISDNLSKQGGMSLREEQMIQLDVLKVFRDFCDKNNLKYFLAEGTLLGAIRHKGFIPWDDDIDIFMPYEDYKRLADIFPTGGRHELMTWMNNPKYDSVFYKLVDTSTLIIEEFMTHLQAYGVFIDIFPLGGFVADFQEREARFKEILDLNFKWDSTRYIRQISGTYLKTREEIEKNKQRDSFYSSPYVGMYHFVSARVSPWAVPREYFEETIDVEFEGELFKSPKGYDRYLTERYGDYMTPPPKNEQFAHGFAACWRRDVEELINLLGNENDQT